MTTRNEYMKTYMRRKRAAQPTSQRGKLEAALRAILAEIEGKTGPTASAVRAIAEGALG